jgi:hypothetical protein
MSDPKQEQSESWAVVELMGHVTMAGRLSEEERFGAKMGRIDVPNGEDSFTTVYFGGSSVYRITAVTEAVARAKAGSYSVKPVYTWKVPNGQQIEEPVRALPNHTRANYDDEGDDEEIPFDDGLQSISGEGEPR